MIYPETRADGWPLCPCCGEDELWSRFVWLGEGEKPPMQAWIDAGLRCYQCGWDSAGEKPRPWPMPAAVSPWEGSARAALLRDVSDILSTVTIPPPVIPPPISRYVLRYGYLVCVECGLVKGYCPGHATDASAAKDGAESGLAKRIAEVAAKRGGR